MCIQTKYEHFVADDTQNTLGIAPTYHEHHPPDDSCFYIEKGILITIIRSINFPQVKLCILQCGHLGKNAM